MRCLLNDDVYYVYEKHNNSKLNKTRQADIYSQVALFNLHYLPQL